jgi:hypothetical protein
MDTTSWLFGPAWQAHVDVPKALVIGADAMGSQVTAPAGVMVGPVISQQQQAPGGHTQCQLMLNNYKSQMWMTSDPTYSALPTG